MTSRIEQLITLCMEEKASETERNELLSLLQAAENEEEAKKSILEALVLSAQWNEAGAQSPQKKSTQRTALPMFTRRASYAAAAAAIIIFGVIVLSRKNAQPIAITAPPPAVEKTGKDIPPGRNKAILTLADGATIDLDNAKKGDIAKDGNARIVKAGSNGILSYQAIQDKHQPVVYNTVTTPRGGQYQLDLSDGSKVWLNASSSVHFPTTFSGKERTVELSGEAYFEIAKNTAMPFSIKVNGITVQVLGTHFNINGYKDEAAVRTTLIEGAVKIVASEQTLLLKPGQQALAVGTREGDAGGALKLVQNADIEEVLAWKNGIFNFKNLDIEAIMRQISRWYDVEVVYEGGKKPEGHFSGMISRNTSAYTVLKMLEYGGIRFKIVDGKIVIS